ncbi:c-type cytochrome [Salipiger abyssi]|uniref:c-type cytochrome n=1 Tax=Salipiger abyssi TaxID=1250539 RepID=UPI001A8D5664|nr:cytochrome c [Salipiger abyssi]MBN9886356.1 cytochrome c [Salipiger abyssi]
MRKVLLSALIAAVPATMALAQTAENETVKARRAFYTMLGFEMGGLAAMAQGKVEYDAEAAQAHAADMVTLTGLHTADFYAPGTSKDDLPGETRALPVIWEDMGAFQEKGQAFGAALAELNTAAGGGLDALRPAVGKLGGACKACHDDFRAADF